MRKLAQANAQARPSRATTCPCAATCPFWLSALLYSELLFSGQLLFFLFLHFPQTVQPHVPPAEKCTAQATLIGFDIYEELFIILSGWDTCIRNELNKKRAPIRMYQTSDSGKRHFGKNPYIFYFILIGETCVIETTKWYHFPLF